MKKIVWLKIRDDHWWKSMFGDESANDDTWSVREFFLPAGRCVSLARRIVFSRKLNARLPLQHSIFAKFLLRRSTIHPRNLREGEVLVLNTFNLGSDDYSCYKSKHTLRLLHDALERHQAFIYLADTVDYLHTLYSSIGQFTKLPSSVVTFSKTEAETRGFHYLAYPFVQTHSDLYLSLMKEKPEFDFSMLNYSDGNDGRIEFAVKLKEVAERCSANFIMNVGSALESVNMKPRSTEPENIQTEDFDARCGDVNCVVQIPRHVGNYVSLTTYEALTYGRKILTTAQVIKDLPCYNPEFIKVISSPDEITPELIKWMMKRVPVKYENLECLTLDHFKSEFLRIVQ